MKTERNCWMKIENSMTRTIENWKNWNLIVTMMKNCYKSLTRNCCSGLKNLKMIGLSLKRNYKNCWMSWRTVNWMRRNLGSNLNLKTTVTTRTNWIGMMS
jgi:hypothetical protein